MSFEIQFYFSKSSAKKAARKAGLDLSQCKLLEEDGQFAYIPKEEGEETLESQEESLESQEETLEPTNPTSTEETVEIKSNKAKAKAEVKPKAPKKEKEAKAPREERNGVKRPNPGGLCAAVWAYLDEVGDMLPKEMKTVAEDQGWNVNNAQIELYQWRKFHGITSQRTAKAS
jgi:hypothetical protein